MASTYIYQSLDAELKEIRLLTIRPSKHCESDQVETTISIVSLLQDPRPLYVTTSYCWGDASERASLVVDGRSLDVPLSSSQAVAAIQSHDEEVTIWIDAVCINQDDKRERSQQVAHMGEVYRYSMENLVYFGPDDEFLRYIEADVDSILADVELTTGSTQSLRKSVMDEGSRWQYSSSPLLTSVNLRALPQLFGLNILRRLWITQEVILAPSNLVLCGTYRCDLQRILDAAAWLSHKQLYALRDWEPNETADLRRVTMLWDMRDNFQRGSLSLGIPYLYSYSRESAVSVSHDHIYSLLSLMPEISEDSTQPLIVPDYERSLGEVFQEATRAALFKTMQLDRRHVPNIFAFVSHPVDMPADIIQDFSSWAPRWDRAWNALADPPRLLPAYSAARDLPDPPRELLEDILQPSGILRMAGYEVCTISAVSSTAEISTLSQWQTVPDWLEEVTNLAVQAGILRSHTISARRLANVLVTEHDHNRNKAVDDFLEGFVHLQSILAHTGELPPLPFMLPPDSDPKMVAASLFGHAMHHTCTNRKFMVTADGRIGLGPKAMQKGDEVVILCYGSTPYVLRPVRDQYLFLGEVYVTGMMHGEESADILARGDLPVMFDLI